MRPRFILEAMVAYPAYGFFRLLPLDIASALGGWIGRYLGYPLSVTQRARTNLERVMPELSPEAREQLLKDMWRNLGRGLGESPHMPHIRGRRFFARVEVVGLEHLEAAAAGGKGFIFFSGHLGNWEITPLLAIETGHRTVFIYRPANNPLINRLILRSRGDRHDGMLPKGKEGARGILEQLKAGKPVGMLVDQKMNEGIPVPFFGRDAMTAPAMVEFARRFGVPILPARIERLKGAHFRATYYPPISVDGRDNLAVMTEVNAMLEDWIRERPEQWFWLHRRWGK